MCVHCDTIRYVYVLWYHQVCVCIVIPSGMCMYCDTIRYVYVL